MTVVNFLFCLFTFLVLVGVVNAVDTRVDQLEGRPHTMCLEEFELFGFKSDCTHARIQSDER